MNGNSSISITQSLKSRWGLKAKYKTTLDLLKGPVP